MVIESCHSTWVFDEVGHRFRRILKGLDADQRPMTGWRDYVGLELDPDSDAFVVLLNSDGTRRLRSWRHVSGTCANCGEQQTTELSVEDIVRLG